MKTSQLFIKPKLIFGKNFSSCQQLFKTTISQQSIRCFSTRNLQLEQQNKPSIDKILQKDFPSSKKEATIVNQPPRETLSSFFKSPFLKRDNEQEEYLGPIREMISVSMKEVPTGALIATGVAILPVMVGAASFYFSSLPAYVLFGYQLNYSSTLLTLLGASHLGFLFADYVHPAKFKSYIMSQNTNFDPTAAKQEEVDISKELEKRKTAHTVMRFVLFSFCQLVAFSCLALPVVKSSLLLAGTFSILSYYDAVMTSRGLAPNWFTSLKVPITIVLVATILSSLFFYLIYGAMEQFDEDTEKELQKFEDSRKKGGLRETINFVEEAKAKKEHLVQLSEQKQKLLEGVKKE